MATLEVGQTFNFVRVVAPQHTVRYLKSGNLMVFATPVMLTWFEEAAMTLLQTTLDDDHTSVGVHIESSHLAPTPVGGRVTIEVTVSATDGKRITFAVKALLGDTLLGEGSHQRVIVNREAFMAKADTMAAERGL